MASPNTAVRQLSLKALLTAGHHDDTIPLWGLARPSNANLQPPAQAADYCRIQIKGNKGTRFEQSARLFAFFSEFFRNQVRVAAEEASSDEVGSTNPSEKALASFLGKHHIVPVVVKLDHDEDVSDVALYPCWGLTTPSGVDSASTEDAKRKAQSSCALDDGSELVASSGYAIPTADQQQDSNVLVATEEKEVAHLSTDFFFRFEPLKAVYESQSPSGVTVAQHSQLIALLKQFRADIDSVTTVGDAEQKLQKIDEIVSAAGKAIALKIPAQAVWRFDVYEGIRQKKKNSEALQDVDNKEADPQPQTASIKAHSHTQPVLAMEEEFLGSILVYLRKLEREKQKGTAAPTSKNTASIVPPVQWRTLDKTQKKRVREIVSLLGLEPLYHFVSLAMAVDKASSASDDDGAESTPQTIASSDENALHRANDVRDTASLIERTMLISALNERAGAQAAETEAGTQTVAPNNNKEKAAVSAETENEAWVREFRAKVANFSRVDTLLEERKRALEANGAAGFSGSGATGRAPSEPSSLATPPVASAAFVPPHPSVDDDDLEMPMGGACYKCGVSGHTTEECKY